MTLAVIGKKADEEQKLRKLMDVVVEKSETKGLDINKKSFVMVFSKNAQPTCHITVKGESLEQVDQFTYLGSMATADAKSDQEIKRRIGISR